ncbi:hypothetical protein HT594_00039 [Phenacoccus solenopsis nudivirus]|nr:hypothetical protein HT594_00039 [Phenacoccus solenopsis nudivirus]
MMMIVSIIKLFHVAFYVLHFFEPLRLGGKVGDIDEIKKDIVYRVY